MDEDDTTYDRSKEVLELGSQIAGLVSKYDTELAIQSLTYVLGFYGHLTSKDAASLVAYADEIARSLKVLGLASLRAHTNRNATKH